MSYSFSDWQAGHSLPKGWDVADAVRDGWGRNEIEAFMRATAKPWTPPPSRNSPDAVADHKPEAETVPPAASAGPAVAPIPSHPVQQMKAVEQEKPEPATVTEIHSRVTHRADDAWRFDLVCDDKGSVKPGVTKNWSLVLENHNDMQGVFAWDAFKLRTMLMRRPPWEREGPSWSPRAVQDRDYSETVMWLEARHMTPKASNIAAVIQTIAERASFDRLREYLDGLEWDGVDRVGKWMTECLGVADTPYARTIGVRWLISSAARGLKPGCKVDTMPILEGPQGAHKSTAIRVLYGDEFFTDELSDIGSKDAMMELQGIWGLEVAEMHRFSAAETNAVKKFLSRQTDRFRPPYGRTVIEAPRRCVLNGTINPEGNAYLRDPTGARRFWPVTVGRIDTDKIANDRDQLWAEAVALYKAKTPWWVQDDEQAAVAFEQELRTDVDVWTSIVSQAILGRAAITQLEVFKALGILDKDIDYRHAGRVGRIMKRLGWEMTRDRSDNDDRVVFRNPSFAKTDDLFDQDNANADW